MPKATGCPSLLKRELEYEMLDTHVYELTTNLPIVREISKSVFVWTKHLHTDSDSARDAIQEAVIFISVERVRQILEDNQITDDELMAMATFFRTKPINKAPNSLTLEEITSLVIVKQNNLMDIASLIINALTEESHVAKIASRAFDTKIDINYLEALQKPAIQS